MARAHFTPIEPRYPLAQIIRKRGHHEQVSRGHDELHGRVGDALPGQQEAAHEIRTVHANAVVRVHVFMGAAEAGAQWWLNTPGVTLPEVRKLAEDVIEGVVAMVGARFERLATQYPAERGFRPSRKA